MGYYAMVLRLLVGPMHIPGVMLVGLCGTCLVLHVYIVRLACSRVFSPHQITWRAQQANLS